MVNEQIHIYILIKATEKYRFLRKINITRSDGKSPS